MINNMTQTSLICPNCGTIFPIFRKTSQQRSLFHRKKLYCIKCNQITNHIELKNADETIAFLQHIDEIYMTEDQKQVYQLIKKR